MGPARSSEVGHPGDQSGRMLVSQAPWRRGSPSAYFYDLL